MLAKASGWLSGRRVRWHATVLAVCIWSAYAFDMATPGLRDRNGLIKGTDFLHFYTLGAVALRGRGDWLYSTHSQAALAADLVRGSERTLYLPLYGPQVSLFFAPLALLPYGWALTVWLTINVAIYFTCCYLVWRVCPALQTERWTVFAAAAAFPGFVHLLAWGQTAGLALACFAAAFMALNDRHPWLAGCALGTLVFKPQLALVSAVVLLFALEWRILLAAAGSALAQLSIGWAVYGTAVMREYVSALLRVRDLVPLLEPRPYQTHCLRTFWSMLVPWPEAALTLYFASALGVLVLAARAWKTSASLPVRYSTLLFATVLVSPHLTVYDLVILAPAFLLLCNWLVENRSHRLAPALKILVYLCYPLFLFGPLARTTRLQASVCAMLAIVWIMCQIATEGRFSLDRQAAEQPGALTHPA